MKIEKLEGIEEKFRELERKLGANSYPNNLANKTMGMMLQSINSFELVVTRFRSNRKRLQYIAIENTEWWRANPEAKFRKANPDEDYVNSAIRVDVESLFMYGLILVQKTLTLIELFFA